MRQLIDGVEVEMSPEETALWEAEQAAKAPTLESRRVAKLDELADYRWQREVGGVAFLGAVISTDLNSQAKITAAYAMAKLDAGYTIPTWEVVPGVFMPLDNATIIAMGEAVRTHVQSTFTRKAALYAEIMQLTSIGEIDRFDFDARW